MKPLQGDTPDVDWIQSDTMQDPWYAAFLKRSVSHVCLELESHLHSSRHFHLDFVTVSPLQLHQCICVAQVRLRQFWMQCLSSVTPKT